MIVAKSLILHDFLHRIIGFLSFFPKQSSFWISQNPSSKFLTHNSKFPNQLSSQDFILVYFSQMTKNSLKFYKLVRTSVTFSSTIFHQSQKNTFFANFIQKIHYIWLKLLSAAEPSFFCKQTSNFRGSLTVLPSSG